MYILNDLLHCHIHLSEFRLKCQCIRLSHYTNIVTLVSVIALYDRKGKDDTVAAASR